MSKGILFFAINNDNINYLKMAVANCLMIKSNMGEDTKVSVVTSTKSIDRNYSLLKMCESKFDRIIIDDTEYEKDNMRQYRNTQYYSVTDNFINSNRHSAYDLSPYDETLLLDVDFLIMDSSFNNVWGCEEDFLINDQAIGLDHLPLLGEEFRLNQTGIKMLWATAIYFKKTERAKLVFDLVSFVKEKWDYYKMVYGFGGHLYRNDFSFSIAIHILNGFIENDDFKKLPVQHILTSTDRDHIYSVSKNNITFLYNDRNPKNQNHEHAFYLTKIKGYNVHIMNKLSLLDFCDDIIKEYTNE